MKAVGAFLDDDGTGDDTGALYILLLSANGTVNGAQKISGDSGGLDAFFALAPGDAFGASCASLGDHDGDNVTDGALSFSDCCSFVFGHVDLFSS